MLQRRSALLGLLGGLATLAFWRAAFFKEKGLVLRDGWLLNSDDR